MYLIFVISLLSLLMAFASKITKMILPFICRDSAEVIARRKEIAKLRSDLAKISMRDEYTRYVRCEREIGKLEVTLNEAKGRDGVKRVAYEYGLHYGGMAVVGLCMMYISIFYRYSTVIVFGDNFNFEPFGGFINFPTKVPNSISVVFWIVVNNFVARTLASYVK
ncbi:guided entry of tail-anchored proteins factor 1-like [Anopheles arabiensis]|uniref:Guided entry of tail-anchored proteins factor 1 n=4 Tax=gambiae species complex TaxID=44542 RepID=Q7QH65_ANOGA|nr:guided entry of tail-anchored proteins factor 1-like [Anopheles arabiensis]XP_040220337.1 guided entry of tail-anchored proteins factor 1-like [Anopheles coluzzii]XP_041762008.1 guided entry of tail-anchored proteins factor 1-like [Anopheles merus]EAA05332.2 AGAP004056-PA [Anopheles gambiae str. PEST]